ncbi:MAG: putative Fe-S protein [Promethearchaeota archaeon]|nr:MAG: putative Fe-S protein [Candidatus Lokiarchaeota archaeon]
MNIIDAFFIIKSDGIPLFSYSPSDELDPNLISGFFSAIQSFSYEINTKRESFINSLTLGNSVFNFLINPKHQLYFVSKSSKNVASALINRHLKIIEEKFLNRFEDDLKHFIGEVSVFENGFKPEFEKYFKDRFVKIKNIFG